MKSWNLPFSSAFLKFFCVNFGDTGDSVQRPRGVRGDIALALSPRCQPGGCLASPWQGGTAGTERQEGVTPRGRGPQSQQCPAFPRPASSTAGMRRGTPLERGQGQGRAGGDSPRGHCQPPAPSPALPGSPRCRDFPHSPQIWVGRASGTGICSQRRGWLLVSSVPSAVGGGTAGGWWLCALG